MFFFTHWFKNNPIWTEHMLGYLNSAQWVASLTQSLGYYDQPNVESTYPVWMGWHRYFNSAAG